MTRADSIRWAPSDSSNHTIRSDAENAAKLRLTPLLAPGTLGICGNHEIVRNVTGRKKHAKHQNMVTESKSRGMLTWKGQRTGSVGIHLSLRRANGGRLHWAKHQTRNLVLPNPQHLEQVFLPSGDTLKYVYSGLLAALEIVVCSRYWAKLLNFDAAHWCTPGGYQGKYKFSQSPEQPGECKVGTRFREARTYSPMLDHCLGLSPPIYMVSRSM